jgi:hypothetical protein
MPDPDDPDLEFDCLDCGRHVCVWNAAPDAREHRCTACLYVREQRRQGLLDQAGEIVLRNRLGVLRSL